MRSCKMTKMHFQLIADVIQGLEVPGNLRLEIAHNFAIALRRTNGSFIPQRFIEACQTEAEKQVEEDERLIARGA